MLTDTKIRQAKAKTTAYKLADAHGMYLLVQPSGAKYWRLKYRVDGREKTFALGVYPEVSLLEARKKRDAARKQIAQSTDPIQAKRTEKAVRRLRAANSFEAVAREWHEKRKSGKWSSGHATSILDALETDIFPSLGGRPIAEITAPEILEVLRKIEKRGALDYLARARQRVSAVFRYAIQTGRASQNPAGELSDAFKTRKQEHYAALDRAQLPEFLNKLDAYDGQLLTRLALKLTVLTFVRSGELRGARWDEFDLERAEWRIPAERMKMKQGHIVSLSRQAIDVLEQLRPITGHGELVFPSQNDAHKVMSENTLLFAMYRMGYHGRATVHGFRATASTILNEMGFKPDVIERQLAHSERNKVRAAYHRSEYLEERRRMLQSWADLLDQLRTGANVVPLFSAA